jgi:hypothetical protein
MKRVVSVFLVIFAAFFYLNGCSTSNRMLHNDDIRGFLACTGGTAAALLTGSAGAFILGFLVTHSGSSAITAYYDEKIKSREDALKKYRPRDRDWKDRRIKLIIEKSLITRRYSEPSSEVEAEIQYTLLGPEDLKHISLSETRILESRDRSFELDERQVMRTQGTYVSKVKFKVPNHVPEGSATLLTTISDGSLGRTTRTDIAISK